MSELVVSVIIITRNRPYLLDHCLARVRAQEGAEREVIVVDSSSDDASERVVARHPGVTYVRLRSERNNMPRARNVGLARAHGDILAFIDDDSMVRDGWLAALAEVYRDSTVGAAGGRVITAPEPYCDEWSGTPTLTVSRAGIVRAKDIGIASDENHVVNVDHLIGCNMSFRRAALERVGGFDEAYTRTNFREDTDLCARVKRTGWRVVFCPEMAVAHFSARSLQPYFLERPSIQFSNGRNAMYFAIKNYGVSPRTLGAQLGLDMGRSAGRAIYFTGMFLSGVVAQLAGRCAGLGAGILWLLSARRQARAAPHVLEPVAHVEPPMNESEVAPRVPVESSGLTKPRAARE